MERPPVRDDRHDQQDRGGLTRTESVCRPNEYRKRKECDRIAAKGKRLAPTEQEKPGQTDRRQQRDPLDQPRALRADIGVGPGQEDRCDDDGATRVAEPPREPNRAKAPSSCETGEGKRDRPDRPPPGGAEERGGEAHLGNAPGALEGARAL